MRNILSKAVHYGENAENVAWRDDRYVRCTRCNYILNLDRHVRSLFGSRAGQGIASATNQYVTRADAINKALIGYWLLDESSGDAVDSIGNNTLTDTNTVTSSTEVPTTTHDGSRQFTQASTQYFTIASPVGFTSLDVLSINAWCRLDSVTYDTVVIAKESVGGAGFRLEFDASTKTFYFKVTNSDSVSATTLDETDTGTVVISTWYNISAVFNRDSVYCYQDNVLVNSAAFTSYSNIIDNTGALRIGQYGAGYGWDGQLCDVAVWKDVLNYEDRKKLLCSTKTNDFTITGGCPFCGSYTFDKEAP